MKSITINPHKETFKIVFLGVSVHIQLNTKDLLNCICSYSENQWDLKLYEPHKHFSKSLFYFILGEFYSWLIQKDLTSF